MLVEKVFVRGMLSYENFEKDGGKNFLVELLYNYLPFPHEIMVCLFNFKI